MAREWFIGFGVLLLVGTLAAQESPRPSEVDQLRAENEALRLSLEAETRKATTLQKLNDAQRMLNQELQKQLDELRKSLEAAAKDREAKLLQVQASLEDLKVASQKQSKERDEFTRLQQIRDDQIANVKRELEAIKQQLLGEQLKGKTLLEKNESLLTQLDETSRKMAQQSKVVEAKPVSLEKTKTAATLRGKVTEVDAARQLLVVNLGTDSGAKQGDVLEVYRVAVDPKSSVYVGQATVIRTTETSSVCRFTVVSEGKLPQLNDAVATNLSK